MKKTKAKAKVKKVIKEKKVDLFTSQNFQFKEVKKGKEIVLEGKPATKAAIVAARKTANKILKGEDGLNKLGFRSCWLCNPGHDHFVSGEWGDWVMNCFECGRFYFDKMDITLYETKKK